MPPRLLAVLLAVGILPAAPATTPEPAAPSVPTPAAAPADCCEPVAGATWHLDSLTSLGGLTPTVLGHPQLKGEGPARALYFDGVQDGIVLPASPLAGLAQFTVEAEINPSAQGNPEQRFFHLEDAAANRLLLEIRLVDGRWALDTFLLHGANRLPLLDRTKLHPTNSWHWVALRYDGRTMSSFVDGRPELSGPVAIAPMAAVGQAAIGVRLNRVYWFQGGIREIRLHPTALDPADLAH